MVLPTACIEVCCILRANPITTMRLFAWTLRRLSHQNADGHCGFDAVTGGGLPRGRTTLRVGYQTLINDTLRRAVEGEHFVQDVRYAIREELAAYAIEKK